MTADIELIKKQPSFFLEDSLPIFLHTHTNSLFFSPLNAIIFSFFQTSSFLESPDFFYLHSLFYFLLFLFILFLKIIRTYSVSFKKKKGQTMPIAWHSCSLTPLSKQKFYIRTEDSSVWRTNTLFKTVFFVLITVQCVQAKMK